MSSSESLQTAAVEQFYDDWGVRRMLTYMVNGNERISRALERVLRYVERDSSVLEIGCGIGVATRAIAKRASAGKVLAVDLSPALVELAKDLNPRGNITYTVGDIDYADRSPITNSGEFDVVAMVDVIEHLDEAKRPSIIKKVAKLARPNARIVCTFPSPYYQKYLAEHDPNELQIIDNVIEPCDLAQEFERAGFRLEHLSYENVWKTAQYVHCVFTNAPPLEDIGGGVGAMRRVKMGILRRWRKLKYKKIMDRVNRKLRKDVGV